MTYFRWSSPWGGEWQKLHLLTCTHMRAHRHTHKHTFHSQTLTLQFPPQRGSCTSWARIDLVATFRTLLLGLQYPLLGQQCLIATHPEDSTCSETLIWNTLLSGLGGYNSLQTRRQKKLIGRCYRPIDKGLNVRTLYSVTWFSCWDRRKRAVILGVPIITFPLDTSWKPRCTDWSVCWDMW